MKKGKKSNRVTMTIRDEEWQLIRRAANAAFKRTDTESRRIRLLLWFAARSVALAIQRAKMDEGHLASHYAVDVRGMTSSDRRELDALYRPPVVKMPAFSLADCLRN